MIYPWLRHQWELLQGQVAQQRLPQALLFNGAEGLGKFELANTLAATLFCQSKSVKPCGECRGCHLFAAGNHPDYFIISPEEKSKTIKIDQVRQLTNKINHKSQEGGLQIAIFYPAEMMTVATANALLKTLEEPPGEVLLILVSHAMSLLPATVLSRCQKVNFYGNYHDDTIEWLNQRIDSSKDAALFLHFANGSPLKALQLAEQGYMEMRDTVLKHLVAIYEIDANPIDPVATFIKGDTLMLLNVYYSLVQDILRTKLGVSEEHIVNKDQGNRLRWLSQQCDLQLLESLQVELMKSIHWMTGVTHLNPQLLIESLFIRFKRGAYVG